MVDIKNKKFGFSLAEALVSMLILSMFFIATSKIITTKPKKEAQYNRHGYFECYYDAGVLKQKRSDGSYSGEVVNAAGNICRFTPPVGIDFVMFYVLDGGSFYSAIEPQFNSDSDDGEDEITISAQELANFHDLYMEDSSDGESDRNILKNFFASSYPSSSIYEQLRKSETYMGPALFIGW